MFSHTTDVADVYFQVLYEIHDYAGAKSLAQSQTHLGAPGHLPVILEVSVQNLIEARIQEINLRTIGYFLAARVYSDGERTNRASYVWDAPGSPYHEQVFLKKKKLLFFSLYYDGQIRSNGGGTRGGRFCCSFLFFSFLGFQKKKKKGASRCFARFARL